MVAILFAGPFLASFFIFSIQLTVMFYIKLPMTGFEVRTSGVGSNCSINGATTNALCTVEFKSFIEARVILLSRTPSTWLKMKLKS